MRELLQICRLALQYGADVLDARTVLKVWEGAHCSNLVTCKYFVNFSYQIWLVSVDNRNRISLTKSGSMEEFDCLNDAEVKMKTQASW